MPFALAMGDSHFSMEEWWDLGQAVVDAFLVSVAYDLGLECNVLQF